MASGILTFTQGNGAATGWTAILGLTVPQVASNELSAVTASVQYAGIYDTVTVGPDMILAARTDAAIPGVGAVILFARLDSSGNGYGIELDNNAWFIKRYDAGVGAELATGSTSAAAHLIGITAIGDRVRGFIDGVQVGAEQIVTAYSTNNHFGIYLTKPSGAIHVDNLSYQDAVASTSLPSRVGSGPGGQFGILAFQWQQLFGNEGVTGVTVVEAVADGSSATSGDVTAVVEKVVTAQGSSPTSGTVTAVVEKVVTASGISATSGTVTAVVTVEAVASGSSATSGAATATVEHIVSAVAAGSSATSGTVTAVVTKVVTASGSSASSGTVTAVVTVPVTASGSSATSGTAVADVSTPGGQVEAVATGSSATSGTVTAVVTVPATASGSSASSGTVTAVVTVPAVAAGSSGTSGSATATSSTPSIVQAVATGTSATSGTATAFVGTIVVAFGPVLSGRDPGPIFGRDPGVIMGRMAAAFYGQDPSPVTGRDSRILQGV